MKIRVDNIECRRRGVCRDGRYEIIKWYPNEYYGAEEQMIADGWEHIEVDGKFFGLRNNNCTVTASCFKNPESAYTVAILEYDDSEGCCDMTTVGTRLLKLKKKDRKAFFKVYKLAEKAIRRENQDSDDEF